MCSFVKNSCPACGAVNRKNWNDLNAEELLLVKKLPRNTEFTEDQRKTHQFCAKCWYEFTARDVYLNDQRT